MGWKKSLVDAKILGSKLESAREWYVWYKGRWRKDYPDLYEPMPSLSQMYWRGRAGRFGHSKYRPNIYRRLTVTGRTKRRQRHYTRIKAGLRYRSKAQSPRLSIGEPVGYGVCKTATTSSNDHFTTDTDVQFPSNTLNAVNISDGIDKATTAQIDERERDIVNVRGYTLCLNIASRKMLEPLMFHWAIVAPKDSQNITGDAFLRGYNEERTRDFKATDVTTLSGTDLARNPINTDAFTVFMHKKFLLHPIQAEGDTTNADYPFIKSSNTGMKTFQKYIRINRQMRFNGAASTTPIYLCWWAASPFKKTSDPAGSTAYTMTYRVVAHFKEPKN